MSSNSERPKRARPTSPHLDIYKLQISSVLSIGHRLSGVGLFVAMAAICWWFILWAFSNFNPYYIEMLDNYFVKAFLFLAIYGFFYHLCTGIRHLVWDTGRGFSICAVNWSGWLAVASSFVLTIIFVLLAIGWL
ncbi:MAG: succinate dehydrogenase, cytochrome b556 subunit [Rickettsiaceae bacterium]|nr:succinate dehydrogenase, cytochrome b556 subunit [Rickettsiaceae bacterium]